MQSLISYKCNFQIALGNIAEGLQFLIPFFRVLGFFSLFTNFEGLTGTSRSFILSQDMKTNTGFAQAQLSVTSHYEKICSSVVQPLAK